MGRYLAKGSDPAGRASSRLVEAPSADAAVARLEQEGWSDLTLLTDDTLADVIEWRADIPPEEQWAAGQAPFWSWFVRTFWQAVSRSLLLWLLVAFVIVRRVMGQPWDVWDWAAIAGIGAGAGGVLLSLLTGGAREYDQLQWDCALGRWERVLGRLDRGCRGLPTCERVRRRAQALAGLGRLDEALEHFDALADDPELPRWVYWSLRSEMLAEAGETAQAVECSRRAYEEAPDNPTTIMALAEVVLEVENDAGRARELLHEARQHQIAEALRFAESLLEGHIAVAEGRDDEAIEFLNRSLHQAGPLRPQPLFAEYRARIEALLAIAEARLGNHQKAVRHFRRAEPVLRAHRPSRLLRECEALLSPAAAGTPEDVS